MSEQRRERLLEALEAQSVDVYIATHTADIRWLTGFAGVFDEEQAHVALILRDGVGACGDSGNGAHAGGCLFTDMRYSAALRELDVRGDWRILDERRPRWPYLAETLVELLKAAGNGSKKAKPLVIGIDNDLRLDWYRALEKALHEQELFNCQLTEMEDLLVGLRAIKTADEVALLKAAQAITDAAFTHIQGFLKPGLTEKEVATELEFFMRRAGATGAAFPSIVASGPFSANPHHVPGQRVLQRGEIVLMDFGARLDDYCSDMTRTLMLGEATEQFRAMHSATLSAQEAVMEMLKPGVEGQEAQKVAEDVIAKHGFAGKLIHSLGHGVGIAIHELPLLAPKITTKLEVGQVVTVEPGVYLEGVGGVRIEDFGLITEDGFEDFTQSSRYKIVV